MLRDHVEAFGDQPARVAHAGEVGRTVKLYLAILALRRDGGVDVSHLSNPVGRGDLHAPCRCDM
jgi:hypothetical protein